MRADVDPAKPNDPGRKDYFMVVRTYPTGVSVYRPGGSDKGNLVFLGSAGVPFVVRHDSPGRVKLELGGPVVNGQPSDYWGYAPMSREATLQLPVGRESSFRFEGNEVKVYQFPTMGAPEIELPPAPGLSNWCLRLLYSLKIHWFTTLLSGVALVASILSYIAYRPRLLENRVREQRRRELQDKFAHIDPDLDRFLNRAFQKWRTVERLGAGGMAVVYRAIPEDSLAEQDSVAIKIMNPELLRDPDYRRRFEREIEISQSLDHPNVVRPIDWGEQSGVLFLVMEYIQGQPLRDIIPKGGFPIAKALQLSIDISAALVYAHKKGIIHRDLKPENIMVTNKGLIKVMDLGLAKRHESDNVTKTGDTFGTPAYMAPEQIAGGGALLPATDQYAMGVILYELVLGVRPFISDDTLTLVLKHLNEAPPRVRSVAPQLPQDLDDVIDKMLAKDPSRRYPGMADVKARLETIRAKYE